MNIPINKDFETEYPQNIAGGFSMKELKFIVCGLAAAISSGLFLIFVLGINYQIGIFAALIPMTPIVLMGFRQNKNGLSMTEAYKAKKYRKKTAVLLYKAREYVPDYPPMEKRLIAEKPDLRKMKREHRKYVKVKLKEQRKEKQEIGNDSK